MNINCIICSDLFLPSSEIYVTECGHMFHYVCLIQWIERSKTCPQCRNKTTEKSVHRVYFNLANTDHITEDVGTLQHKIDSLQFQITLKDKDVQIYKTKYRKLKNQNLKLREEVCSIENKMRASDSAIHALKDQISYFKFKAKENDKLTEEIVQMKNKLRDVDHALVALDGTREQVNEIIRTTSNFESLAIIAATLKKSLIESERKNRELEKKLKCVQTDMTKYRRDKASLENLHANLKKQLELYKDHVAEDKSFINNKMMHLKKKADQYMQLKDDIPMKLPKRHLDVIDIDSTHSPTVADNILDIKVSDSPYLQVKCNSVHIDPKYTMNPAHSSKFSIFKPSSSSSTKIEDMLLHSSNSETDKVYDGLGSHTRHDFHHSSPKSRQTNLKRTKSSSSISSTKFRKLSSSLAPHKLRK